MSLKRVIRTVFHLSSRRGVQPRQMGGQHQGRIQRRHDQSSNSDTFRFAPELFEYRTEVLEKLSESGFVWLTHFSSVDPLHDVYGIEVCGIPDQEDAIAIRDVLMDLFPSWKPG